MRAGLCIFLLLSITIMIGNESPASELRDISKFEWQNRIILVKSSGDGAGEVSLLADNDRAVEERHIYWFILARGEVLTNYIGPISSHFATHMKQKYFAKYGSGVVLVGKDGGVKQRQSELELKEIFHLIDQMPMRQAEMREQQQ